MPNTKHKHDKEAPKKIHPLRTFFLGSALRNERLEGELLPKSLALPIFASDPLSSVAYGPQELMMILTLGGLSFLTFAPGIAIAVALLLTVIVLSYRKVIQAYPSGGGDYEVAKSNLGRGASLTVAAALLLDYIMTVAVSIASGTDNLISAFPEIAPYRVEIAIGFLALIFAINLRGIRESGVSFAIPTYVFITTVMIMIGTGLYKFFILGQTLEATSAHYDLIPTLEFTGNPTQVAVILLLLRAFASGCSALTGIEAIANGVPAFRAPKIKNANITMALMGSIAITMFLGTTWLAITSGVKYLESEHQLGNPAQIQEFLTNPQQSLMAQIGVAVFGDNSIMFYILQAATAAVLLLAANTAFNGFPLLSSVLSKDGFAPKMLQTRGDRLVYSNGMLSLATVAGALILVYQASVSGLIQLYIIGVFTSFTVGQLGMIRHWRRGIREKTIARKEALSGLIINGLGAFMTSSVLVIVTITKFTHGAWIVFIIMPLLWILMYETKKYYTEVEKEIQLLPDMKFGSKGDYAIVLMDKLTAPQLKALDYALSSKHDRLEVVHIAVDDDAAARFEKEWTEYGIQVPLRVIPSPFRDFGAPLSEYLTEYRSMHPEQRMAVYLPKYVVGHWWEHIFHNHRANRIRKQLMYVRGAMITIVPWRLESADKIDLFSRTPMPGDARRGEPLRGRGQMRRHSGGQNKIIRMKPKENATPDDILDPNENE
ncbi:MAG: APC family permease [Micrococcales bacterium]|nr:APC family permease [Micrococcales bacterium]NBR55176.1 APC family permease [Micrococcales bacterium]NBR61862.1 APC family permease [Actinomycetota bacterium]NBT48126.1 APC family permease [Actinomycetota bacterium]NBY43331.1 APC family permease [Micrococcales bacterium]